MVDPLEAKKLAAKEMERIKAKERIKVSGCCIIPLHVLGIKYLEKSAANHFHNTSATSLQHLNMLQPLLLKCCLQRQREIEAVNGAWAMIGLTAGLVIEGHTGHSIPAQVISLTETKKKKRIILYNNQKILKTHFSPQFLNFPPAVGWILGCTSWFFPEIVLQ